MRRPRPSRRRDRFPRTLFGSLLAALVPAVALYAVSYPVVAAAVAAFVLTVVASTCVGRGTLAPPTRPATSRPTRPATSRGR
ncbi:hypothetical protein ACFQJD_05275 [Haloplanus sp. GCM10025708]|uniref:hypothetical protein n=1 Tax=Haloplanus sp. GCM10025708 TaxID=3252679 RepID=UPI00360C7946